MRQLSGFYKKFFLVIILGVTVVWVIPKILQSNEMALFIILSDAPDIWVKEPGESYRLKSDERFVYYDRFHNNLISFTQIDSDGEYYSLSLDTGFIQFPQGCFRLLFTEDSREMEQLMAKGQEGSECIVLSAHDCLYNAEVWPYVLTNEGPLFQRFQDNLMTLVRFIKGRRVSAQELESGWISVRSGRHQQKYRYGFYSKESGQSYLLSDLPAEEHTWELHYYPTILINGSILYDISFSSCYEDNSGELFNVADPLNLYNDYETIIERFYQIDSHHYVLTLSTCTDSLSIDKDVYFEDTRKMNSLIQKYYKSLYP